MDGCLRTEIRKAEGRQEDSDMSDHGGMARYMVRGHYPS